MVGQDNIVVVATSYRLDGPGIKAWWGVRFSSPVHIGTGAHSPSYTTMGTGSFPEAWWGGKIFFPCSDRSSGPLTLLYNGYRVFPQGVKRPGRSVDHPPLCSAQVKERVKLLPLWTFMACYRVNYCCTLIIK